MFFHQKRGTWPRSARQDAGVRPSVADAGVDHHVLLGAGRAQFMPSTCCCRRSGFGPALKVVVVEVWVRAGVLVDPLHLRSVGVQAEFAGVAPAVRGGRRRCRDREQGGGAEQRGRDSGDRDAAGRADRENRHGSSFSSVRRASWHAAARPVTPNGHTAGSVIPLAPSICQCGDMSARKGEAAGAAHSGRTDNGSRDVHSTGPKTLRAAPTRCRA